MIRRTAGWAVAAFLICTGIVLAHDVAYPTSAVLAFQPATGSHPDRFRGVVSSSNEKCVPARKVKLYHFAHKGTPDPSQDVLVGSDTTNADGRYVIVPDEAVGPPNYYAKVTKSDRSDRPGHDHICSATFSNTAAAA